MNHTSNLPGWFLLAALTTAVVPASAAVNPYVAAITNRNMFGLKAPPSAEELAALNVKPPEALPKVLLTGITTLMGGKRALLRVQRVAKPPEPAKEIPLILAEGSPAEEEVQVLEIDVAAGTVKISNRGTSQLLDITKDSPKPSAAPPVAAAVAGLRPGGAIPLPGGRVPPPGGGGIPIPPRPMRGAGGGGGNNNPTAGVSASGVESQSSASSIPHMTPDEQTIMIEVERERTKALVESGEQPPLPLTELTEEIMNENNPLPPAQ